MLLKTYCVWQATDNTQRLLRHRKITNSVYLRKQDNQSSCAINWIRLCLWTWRGRCKNHTLFFTTDSTEKTHSYTCWQYQHLCSCGFFGIINLMNKFPWGNIHVWQVIDINATASKLGSKCSDLLAIIPLMCCVNTTQHHTHSAKVRCQQSTCYFSFT